MVLYFLCDQSALKARSSSPVALCVLTRVRTDWSFHESARLSASQASSETAFTTCNRIDIIISPYAPKRMTLLWSYGIVFCLHAPFTVICYSLIYLQASPRTCVYHTVVVHGGSWENLYNSQNIYPGNLPHLPGCFCPRGQVELGDRCVAPSDCPLEEGSCSLPPQLGPCEGDFPRWFYNSSSEFCQPFAYGGCEGNSNNFPNPFECLEKCRG